MIKLFDPENKFWQFLNKVTDAALMSLLCLPLVPIGASTAAFYSYTLKQVSNQEGSLVKSYFSAFRAHFKRATLLWLLQAAGTAFFAADLWAVWNFLLIQGGAAGVAVLGVCGWPFCAAASTLTRCWRNTACPSGRSSPRAFCWRWPGSTSP